MVILVMQHAFRLHCMLPVLQLLETCRQWPSSDHDQKSVTRSSEVLLINHVILPFRAVNLQIEQRVEAKDGELSSSFCDELVSTLKQYRFPWPGQQSSTSTTDYVAKRIGKETQEHLTVAFLVLLFDIALTCRPRHLPRLRGMEDPWLGELFTQLTECFKELMPANPTVGQQKNHVRLTTWLLRKAIHHKLQLRVPIIETILDQTSGLCTNKDDVEWIIVSLSLLSDANAFVVPASSPDSGQTPAARPPNRHLSALLSKITDLDLRPSPNASQEDRDYVLSKVLIPLGTAFSEGRDLMGFLSHWKDQLNLVQLDRSKEVGCPSLWENQRLLQTVAHLAERTLTPGQIGQLLSAAVHGLATSVPDEMDHEPVSLANLVLLDCLFGGITLDTTIKQLAATAQLVYSSLEAILSSGQSRRDQWRMWRVEGVIAERWFPIHSSPTFKKSTYSATDLAIRMIKDTEFTKRQLPYIDLTERLHAFAYILRFIARDDSFWEDAHFLSRQHIVSAVEKILNVMEPFCSRIRQDIFGTIKSPDSIPKWEEFHGPRIVSMDTFYIACVGHMMISPCVLE